MNRLRPRPLPVMHEFTCAVCGKSFLTRTTEAEASREFLESGQPGTSVSSACDRCYKIVMTKAREQGLLTSAPPGAGEGVANRNTPPQETEETEK